MRALVTRLGAFGDLIICSPLFRLLKQDGYEVTANVNSRGASVLRNNPHIDKVMLHDESIVDLDKHWTDISKDYDRFINLTGTIEGRFLFSKRHNPDKYGMTHEERNALATGNYYDYALEYAGYDSRGLNGELYFSPAERIWAHDFRKKYKRKFLVLWALSGSSYHKAYPHAENVINAFLDAHPDVQVVTTGDELCILLEPKHERCKNYNGLLSIRKTLMLTYITDLVISPETATLNASGCYNTPKIALLSHSSAENLTKHFKNCTNISADVDCHPCHRLLYELDECELDAETKAPVCAGKISPAVILNAMEDVYQKWREHNGTHSRDRELSGVC